MNEKDSNFSGNDSTASLEASSTGTPYQRPSFWFILIIGLGFATTSLTWALFNIAIPSFLKHNYGLTLGVIGFIMTWDNIIAFFLQPWIGAKSDSTWNRLGRRMPYLMVGIPLASIFFALIPFARQYQLPVFLGTILLFNLSMAIYRSPTVALMPDFIPTQYRSFANGLINLMGGVFAAFSLFVSGGFLETDHPEYGFMLNAVIMLFSLLVMKALIKERPPEEMNLKLEPTEFKIIHEIKKLTKYEDKSLLFMLLAIMSWFMAWNAVEAFYGLYVAEVILPNEPTLIATGKASKILSVFPVIFVLSTIIGGYIGGKIGRIPTMKIGIVIFFAVLSWGFTLKSLNEFRYVFMIAAFGWALINVNSIVVVWEHSKANTGTGTGLYYAFSSAAAILGPTLGGFIFDHNPIGIRALFAFSLFFIALAFVFISFVKTGEAFDNEKIID